MAVTVQSALNATLVLVVLLLSAQLHTTTRRLEALEEAQSSAGLRTDTVTRRALAEAEESEQRAECYGADEVAMVALNASVALSQSYARLEIALASKANASAVAEQSTLDTLTATVGEKAVAADMTIALAAKADVTALDALTATVGEKAVAADMTTALAAKADVTALDTLTVTVGEKAVATDMTTALAAKADVTALDTLTVTVGEKAVATDMTTALAAKADVTALDALTVTVGEKAVAADMTTALAAKADVTALDALTVTVGEKAVATDMTTALAAKADASALVSFTTTVSDKADQSALDALSATISSMDFSTVGEAAAAALLANGCEASGDSPSDCIAPDAGTGCDAGDGGTEAECTAVNQFCSYTPATVTTCDPPEDGLVATGCTVASGPGACSAVPHTCATSPATCPLTTALGLKADQAELDSLVAEVGTKAVNSEVTAALSDKADVTAMNTALGLKADQTDLDTLSTEVGTKASQADLDTLSTTVATQSGLPDVIYDGSSIDTWVASLGSGLPGIYKLRLSGDAQSFAISTAVVLTSGQEAQIISTATGDSTLTFGSIVTLQNGATLSLDGSIRFNCLALYYFADPRMNAGEVTFGTGASIVCTNDATADLSGELPGTVTVTPSDGGGAVTISRSGSSAFVPTEQQVPWVGVVAMFDGSQTMIGEPRGSFMLYQLPAVDFSGTDTAADLALYVEACASFGLRTVGSGSYAYVRNCESSNCLPVWEGVSSDVGSAVRHYSIGQVGWTGGDASGWTGFIIHNHDNGNAHQHPSDASWLGRHPVCGLEYSTGGGGGGSSASGSSGSGGTVSVYAPVYDGYDITAWTAALATGLSGDFILRLSGDVQSFVNAKELNVYSGQSAQIISAATGTSTLNLGIVVTVAAGASLSISGTIRLANPLLLIAGAEAALNPGTITLSGAGISVALPGGTTPGVSGELPGTVTVDGQGTVVCDAERSSCTANGLSWWPDDSWDSGSVANVEGKLFTLYKLPPVPNGLQGFQGCCGWSHSAAAGLYGRSCEVVGLRTFKNGRSTAAFCRGNAAEFLNSLDQDFNCIQAPSHWENDNVGNTVRTVTGWEDIVTHHQSNIAVNSIMDGSDGSSTALSAICALEYDRVQTTAGSTSGAASSASSVSMIATSSLPDCTADSPPAIAYTHTSDLDMDVLVSCSKLGGVAAWRPMLTAGGLMYDGSDIDAWTAALGSGQPGTYALRLSGDAQAFVIPTSLSLTSGQDARVISTATSDSTLAISDTLSLSTGSEMSITGTIQISGDILIAAAYYASNAGVVTFGGGVTTMSSSGVLGQDLTGSLPGTVTVTGGALTVSRTGSDAPTTTSLFSWVGITADPTAAVASGMAIPKIEPTPAIEDAAVASIDESADSVTLAQIDASVAAGQALQLSDAAGQTCAAAPKEQDLTVLSVSGAAVSFSTDITSGDASASTNCVLSRAESYDLPACEAGDPPTVIYTRDPGLDMDELMTCSEMGGEAAWRSVLTMGGVIFDSPDIAGFIAAIGSGLPGMYVLRLFGDAQSFSIPQLDIFPYQDVRILSRTTGDSTVEFEGLGDCITLAAMSSLSIHGSNGLTLDFGDGGQQVVIGSDARLSVVGDTRLSTSKLLIVSLFCLQGTFSFSGGVSVSLSDGTTPTLTGELPGTVNLESNGQVAHTAARAVDGTVTAPSAFLSAVSGTTTVHEYEGGALFRMPLASAPVGDNQAGTNWYIDLCDAAGLSAVGCTDGNYATAAQYTQVGRGGGVNGWGDMGCNIDGWISSNTGWSNFIHLESSGNYLDGDFTGTNANVYGSSSPVHPICAIPP